MMKTQCCCKWKLGHGWFRLRWFICIGNIERTAYIWLEFSWRNFLVCVIMNRKWKKKNVCYGICPLLEIGLIVFRHVIENEMLRLYFCNFFFFFFGFYEVERFVVFIISYFKVLGNVKAAEKLPNLLCSILEWELSLRLLLNWILWIWGNELKGRNFNRLKYPEDLKSILIEK